MPKRRKLFRLGEVEIELDKHVGRNASLVLFTDLEQGTLQAVVQFPAFRDGLTEVTIQLWKNVDRDEFVSRSGRRKKQVEFELAAEDFGEAERMKLRATTLAVFRRTVAEMDADYLAFFRGNDLLKNDMTDADWEKLLLRCFRWQRELSEEAGASLVPMVTSDAFEAYIAQVRADASPARGTPGRKPADSWISIYEEAIRQLAANSELLKEGNVQGFAKTLNQWGIEAFGRNAGVPNVATIAERLREVRNARRKA